MTLDSFEPFAPFSAPAAQSESNMQANRLREGRPKASAAEAFNEGLRQAVNTGQGIYVTF